MISLRTAGKAAIAGAIGAGALFAAAGPAFAHPDDPNITSEQRVKQADELSKQFTKLSEKDHSAVVPLPVLQAIAETDSGYDAGKQFGDKRGLYQLTPEDIMQFGTDGDGDGKVDAFNYADNTATAVNKAANIHKELKDAKAYPSDFREAGKVFFHAWSSGTKATVKAVESGNDIQENKVIAETADFLVKQNLYKVQ